MPELVQDGTLVLYGVVGDDYFEGFTSSQVLEALSGLGQEELLVRLNSPGGFAHEGIAIYNALRLFAGRITVQIDAAAHSAASVIAMAGEEIRMMPGSMMMVHDPSKITIGNAEDHRRTAQSLDLQGDTVAKIYASRTGQSEQEIRALMKAETWMDGRAAVEAGFATEAAEEADAAQMSAPVFNYAAFSNAPDALLELTRNWQAEGVPMVAAMTAADVKERNPDMPKENPSAPSAPEIPTPPPAADQAAIDAARLEAQTQERDRVNGIYAAVRSANLQSDVAEELVRQGVSLNDARAKIIDKIADMNADDETVNATRTRVTLDGVDKFKEGAAKALMAKAEIEGGERNEFSSMSLMELGRESLNVRNLRPPNVTRMELAGMYFVPTMAGGMHSTSDFGEILANVANKSMLRGFTEANETFQQWTSTGTLSDFKPAKRVGLNAFGALTEVPAGAEYTYGTIGEHAESVVLATYGKLFSITRQAIVNDDLSAFTRIPGRMGRAAIRTVGNLVYAVVTGNPTMADGTELFHADHGNLAASGGAPSGATINAGITAMAKQKDRDGQTEGSNITPRYILLPHALRETVLQVLNSEYDPSKTTRAANTVRGAVEPIMDARLDAASATGWYLAADPNAADTIEVSYLDGMQTPTLEQQEGWKIDGSEFKVRIDAGVKALAWEGLYKNAGA
ncbi:MAG: Clp protease ClpP [Roseibium sp.]|nr:Clp protease ClpP [Roseibium sp.]